MLKVISLLPENEDITFFLDKPVIMIPNYWRNPIIGFVNDIQDGKLIVHDYISDETIEAAYRTFVFTEQRYQLVLKLDPFELCSILYPEEYPDTAFIKEKTTYLLTPEAINETLRKNCFWSDLLEYREEMREAIA